MKIKKIYCNKYNKYRKFKHLKKLYITNKIQVFLLFVIGVARITKKYLKKKNQLRY